MSLIDLDQTNFDDKIKFVKHFKGRIRLSKNTWFKENISSTTRVKSTKYNKKIIIIHLHPVHC